jgi:hypothetical protein
MQFNQTIKRNPLHQIQAILLFTENFTIKNLLHNTVHKSTLFLQSPFNSSLSLFIRKRRNLIDKVLQILNYFPSRNLGRALCVPLKNKEYKYKRTKKKEKRNKTLKKVK